MSEQDLIAFGSGTTLVTPSADIAKFFQDNVNFQEAWFIPSFAQTNIPTAEYALASKGGFEARKAIKKSMTLGLDWVDVKHRIVEILLDPKAVLKYPDIHPFPGIASFDEDTLSNLQNIVLNEETIPVRSGLLKDTIMITLHITPRQQWYESHILHCVAYQTPPIYPYPIPNVQHSQKEGVGLTYSPIFPIPNWHKIVELEMTHGAYSLYLLNDPYAEPDYQIFLNPKLQDYYARAFAWFFTMLDLAIYMWISFTP